MTDSIQELTREICTFSDERGWCKNGRVDLKGMAISISLEAAELLEHFQWIKDGEIDTCVHERKAELKDELADVAIYVFQFADRMGIDLAQAVREKMEKNAKKYPIEKE